MSEHKSIEEEWQDFKTAMGIPPISVVERKFKRAFVAGSLVCFKKFMDIQDLGEDEAYRICKELGEELETLAIDMSQDTDRMDGQN
jgi:hypothetical protein